MVLQDTHKVRVEDQQKSRKEQPEEEPASGQADTEGPSWENCIMKEEERILYEAVEKLRRSRRPC